MPDFAIERCCEGMVCGVDEAGRGPLAGPVVAAAVVIDRQRFRGALRSEIDDSKALTREAREGCYAGLRRCARAGIVRIGVGAASVGEIDRINILRASLVAMRRAVAALGAGSDGRGPDIALVDGNIAPPLACAVRTVIKGDGLSLSIAAASIIAKVTRDRLMTALARRYPGYGWDTNAGYATREHGEGLRRLGVTPHHRRSFEPVRLTIAGPVSLLDLMAAAAAGDGD